MIVIRKLTKISLPLFILIEIVLVIFIGGLDYLTGTEFSFDLFYLLPIALGTWFIGRRAGILISIGSAIVRLVVILVGEPIFIHTLHTYWNTVTELTSFII